MALPYCRTECCLDVHVEIHDGVWMIPIAKSKLDNKALLRTLYAGVHYLLNHEVASHGEVVKSVPFKDWYGSHYSVYFQNQKI